MDSYHHERTATTCATLTALRTDLAHLSDLRGAGRIRRWAGWGPSPEQIAQAGARHAAERAETFDQLRQGLAPIGASPAPADLIVLDTLRDVETDLADLLDAVCDRVAPTIRRSATNPRRIAQIITLLTKVGADDDLLGHVLSETRRLHRRVRYALGDTEDVRQLRNRCPICGARSLRELPDRGVVVCANPGCWCDDPACGCHDEHRPRRHEWSALEGIPA
ncbi:hypothetical protein KIK06_23490 [Nocardiopsis sp. EMB25]|uniref:hypothetical protein n=1 Tax=Nocardiopsis sp. EMB25 TaxID=2835867 RepID=UPI002283F2C5|nr:hypothetical protein [Nocardiopsis sp. EMB25]MCY9786851.1 hypothetical protein [Nocardiopsis sp. EMB25]